MPPLFDSIGYRLRTLRQYRGQSQHALAAYFGAHQIPITRNQLANWETDRSKVPSEYLGCLATALHVSLLDLLPEPVCGRRGCERRPTGRIESHRKATRVR